MKMKITIAIPFIMILIFSTLGIASPPHGLRAFNRFADQPHTVVVDPVNKMIWFNDAGDALKECQVEKALCIRTSSLLIIIPEVAPEQPHTWKVDEFEVHVDGSIQAHRILGRDFRLLVYRVVEKGKAISEYWVDNELGLVALIFTERTEIEAGTYLSVDLPGLRYQMP